MEKQVQAVIVDDDVNEGGSIVDLLNKVDGDLKATLLTPKPHVEATAAAALDALGEDGPRLLLLDYRLGDNPIGEGKGEIVDFKGGTVAGFVRDKEPEIAIALLTSEEKLHNWVERRTGIKELFDWTLIKNKVTEPGGAERVGAMIVDYARSWERARNWQDGDNLWERMAELLQAPSGEIALFAELEAEAPKESVTAEIMHWVLQRALRIPGPLIGSATTRIVLGLTPASFETSEVMGWLDDAKYAGALSAFEERWWGRLVRAKLAEVAGGERPLDASARAGVLGKHLNIELQHEGCSWCQGERTLQACDLCKRATDAAHSVRPVAPPLPAWADSWVVCYRCIAEGQADDVSFPRSAQDIVAALAEGRIRTPDE